MLFSYIRKNSLIIKLILSYTAVFVIPIFFGILVYNETVKVVELDIREASSASLAHIAQNVDGRISEMQMTIDQHLENPKIQNFQTYDSQFTGANVYSIIDARNSIFSSKVSNSFIKECFFMFNKSELALAEDLTYTYEQFYDKILSFDGVSFEEWKKDMNSPMYKGSYHPSQQGAFWGKRQDLLIYQQSFSFINSEYGGVLLVLNSNEISDQLQQLNIADSGWAYVTDNQGNLLSSTVKEAEFVRINEAEIKNTEQMWKADINGNHMMINTYVSEKNGFCYISVQPENAVFNKVTSVKNLIFISMLSSVLISLLVSFILAYRYSQPLMQIINNISHYFSGQESPKPSLSGVPQSVLHLLENNSELKNMMSLQKPFLTAAFFRQLILNDIISEDEFNRVALSLNINTNSSGYQVILFQLDTDTIILEGDVNEKSDIDGGVNFLIKEVIKATYKNQIEILDISEKKMALFIFDCPIETDQQQKAAQDILTVLKEQLPVVCNLNMVLALGGRCDNLYKISRSYSEAQTTLNNCLFSVHREIVWYDSNSQNDAIYYFPIDLQTKISNAVVNGNRDEVHNQLHQLYQENIVNRCLQNNMVSLLIQNLWSNIMQIIQPLTAKEQISSDMMDLYQLMNNSDEIRKFEITNQAYYALCETFNEKRELRHKEFILSIVEDMNKSYTDPNLSLAIVAQHHKISEAYLSNIFTQETGENYSVYIEKLRMKKAMELILSSDMTIQKIAIAVGYYSSNTFCRAFKRVNGISATAYRSNNK